MTVLKKAAAELSLPQGIKKLRSELEKFLSSGSKNWAENKFIRFETVIAPVEFLPWLNAQKDPIKVYWQDRSSEYIVAAVGSADIVCEQALSFDILRKISQHTHINKQELRYFGGLFFNSSEKTDPIWQNFGKLCFILPQIELSWQQGKTTLACQMIANPIEIKKTLLALDRIVLENFHMSSDLALPESRLDTPSQLLWEKHAREILSIIEKDSCQKVVLARQVKLQFKEPVNPILLLSELTNIALSCFCFYFQFKNGEAFLGASPERLYFRDGRTLYTEALAGTRPRGISKKEDDLLQSQLKTSQKDLNEQAFVTQMITDTLLSLCKNFSHAPAPALLSWNGGHHLITHFKGELKDQVDDAEILTTLHPTAAVAGTPTKKALGVISKYEPFSRGWYAGPVGYFGCKQSEFAVAIRSGLLVNNNLYLYAGAGIVKGSLPQAEWEETENKLSNFLKIFNADKK